jgi:hypothetical protein
MSESAEFGWGAPPFAEQFPTLDREIAEHFDLDNKAIIRLHVRGAITDSQLAQAIKKVTKQIEKELSP